MEGGEVKGPLRGDLGGEVEGGGPRGWAASVVRREKRVVARSWAMDLSSEICCDWESMDFCCAEKEASRDVKRRPLLGC